MIEPLLHSSFDDIGQGNRAQHAPILRHQQRCSTRIGNVPYTGLQGIWNAVAAAIAQAADRLQCAFTDFATVDVDARHSRLRGKWNESSAMRGQITAAQLVTFLCEQTIERPSGVSSAREESCAA